MYDLNAQTTQSMLATDNRLQGRAARRVRLARRGVGLLAGALLALFVAGCASTSKTPTSTAKAPALTPEQQSLNVESFDYAWTTIRDRHWDAEMGGLDWEAVRDELRPRVAGATTMRAARGAMGEMIERLGKSHFAVIPNEAYKALGSTTESGVRDGTTGIDARVIDDQMLVTSILPGSPADQAGVKLGWAFVKIDDKDVAAQIETLRRELADNPRLEYILDASAVRRTLGAIGDTVSVSFLTGDDEMIDLELTFVQQRGRKYQFGHLPAGYVWIETRLLDQNVGYIAFNNFMDPARLMPAFNNAMKSFKGADGVIIDLRGNGGGIGAMAMGMAGWLVTEKSLYLGTLKTRETELKLIVSPRLNAFTGPAAVLVDGMSGSSSEFLAGGLQDMGRAQIVGTRTVGAALPSAIEKLPNGDGFQYAFGNYVSAGGKELEGDGVSPDIEVAHTREALLQGRDLVLEAALEWIQNQ